MAVHCNSKPWHQIRLRAGPLVKVLRYQRPQLRPGDLPSVRKEKNAIIREIRSRSLRRTPKDRLEIVLALMGWGCSVYTLTFADETLPVTFGQTRDFWRGYAKGMNRLHGGAFPYVYVIEGLHGNHRWHIHAVLRDADFSEADVLRHWGGGAIEDVQPLLDEVHKTFRQRADYFSKERRDGLIIPKGVKQWVAAPMLYDALAPPVRNTVGTGTIRSPKDVWSLTSGHSQNDFGEYYYKSWIEYP